MEDKLKERFIRKSDITSIPELKNNPITNLLIKRFSKGNKIKANEMLQSLRDFLESDSLEVKLKILFSIYDSNSDGYISSVEFYELLKTFNHNYLENWKLQNIVDKTFAEIDEYSTNMNFEQFKGILIKNNKDLLKAFNCTKK
ncbi:hypothetical protein NUSPORA_02065 [Nucleospora cyclopteri]